MSTPKTFDYTQSSKDLRSKYKKQPSEKERKQSTKKAAGEIIKLGLTPPISANSKFTSVKNVAEQVEGLKSAGTGVLSNMPSTQQSFSNAPISQSQTTSHGRTTGATVTAKKQGSDRSKRAQKLAKKMADSNTDFEKWKKTRVKYNKEMDKPKNIKSPVEKTNQMGGGPNAWDPSLAAKSIVEKQSAAEKKGPLYKSGNPLSKYGSCRK